MHQEPATDQIVTLYRNPEADWVKQRGMLYFLPDNISFSEVPGMSSATVERWTAEQRTNGSG